MALSYAAVLKKAISNQPTNSESSYTSRPKTARPATVASTAAPSRPAAQSTSASTTCSLPESQHDIDCLVAAENSTTVVTNSPGANDSSADDAYLEKILRNNRTAMADVDRYTLAKMMKASKRGWQAAEHIAMAQPRIEKTYARGLKKKVEAARAKFPLMRLPFEIRLKILDLAIKPITGAVFGPNCEHPMSLPPVARTRNQDLDLESLIVTIEKSEFEICSKRGLIGLETWLSKIDLTLLNGSTSYRTGFDAVKALNLDSLMYGDSEDEEKLILQRRGVLLMSKCENLRTAEVCIERTTLLCCSCLDDPGPRPALVETIVRECSFDRILSLPHLETLRLELTSSEDYPRLGFRYGSKLADAVHGAMKNLKSWFETEFEKRGQRVEIHVPTNPSRSLGW